jgi:hypothetical protein
MSLEEAVEYYKHLQGRHRRFLRHARAVSIQIAEDYESQTGLKWLSGQRVNGRPKRGGATARREAAEAAQSAGGRKAA